MVTKDKDEGVAVFEVKIGERLCIVKVVRTRRELSEYVAMSNTDLV